MAPCPLPVYRAQVLTSTTFAVQTSLMTMFETDINLHNLGLDGKPIQSITFTKASGALATGIFAVSGNASAATLTEGGSVTLSGSITDPGRNEAQTVNFAWGDGTSSTLTIPAITASPGVTVSAPYNWLGHTYYVIKANNLTWQQAEAQAQLMGGHLAAINSVAENEHVEEILRAETGAYTVAWIGLNDTANKGNFTWSNGDPLTLAYWSAGQPNTAAGQDYVAVNSGGNASLGHPFRRPTPERRRRRDQRLAHFRRHAHFRGSIDGRKRHGDRPERCLDHQHGSPGRDAAGHHDGRLRPRQSSPGHLDDQR